MTLRVVEVYASYQGEGPNTSRPTVFVRFAGCNFKCPGWPCDTQHAIQPEQFKKLQTHQTPEDLVAWVDSFNIKNVCLTGGEVYLQNKKDLVSFVNKLSRGHNVEVFTNGSLTWHDTVSDVACFILDWKLSGSGEKYDMFGDTFFSNVNTLNEGDAVKFTIADRKDYEEAVRRYNAYSFLEKVPVYAGVVWGKLETEELCKWMLEDNLPWNLNVQVHKFVWHPDKQGV